MNFALQSKIIKSWSSHQYHSFFSNIPMLDCHWPFGDVHGPFLKRASRRVKPILPIRVVVLRHLHKEAEDINTRQDFLSTHR